ncbi:MAG: metal ABC transporter ATP-binding protein [Candidatus Omnitrophica bacterium]|nr:metal ABC transporter ATP-binding protein [Candidatus Omnitrophota bacterium]
MPRDCGHCCTRISDLNVKINGHHILQNINLHINCGEILAIIGPNGAGKTTLLNAILGEMPYTGKMSFLVKKTRANKPKIGYVPQRLQIEPNSPVSVQDFVSASISNHPIWTGFPKKVADQCLECLKPFSAEHLIKRKICELSGGELQRVLLATAMVPTPDLLLLDEPGTGVDVSGLVLFYELVRGLRTQHDISVIIVTHDLFGVAEYVDHLVLLNRSIIAEGTPQEVLSDKKTFETFAFHKL